MKIILLMLAFVAAFGFAVKKTIDGRVLLAKRLEAERNMTPPAVPHTVALL